MTGPLDGVRVVELSEMIAAPYAGMHLADLGAVVIKVEPPTGDPWRQAARFAPNESRSFLSLNRNKRGVAIDLKTSEGVDVVHRLVRDADVVLINYRPDTPAKLGVDYDTLRAVNERIVYVEATAMGRRGPYAHRPGYDLVAQAVTGLLRTGQRFDRDGRPLPITPAIADYGSGMAMAMAVCAALVERMRTGVGQRVEATLLATSLSLQTAGFLRTSADSGNSAEHRRDELDAERRALSVYYRVYETVDSSIAVACLTPALRRRMADAIGVVDPRSSPDFSRRDGEAMAPAGEFMERAEQRFREKTTTEWMARFDAAGVPAGPVLTVDELLDDPQVRANDLVVEVDHPVAGRVELVGPLVRFEGAAGQPVLPPPTLGQHTEEVLTEFGYDADGVDRLRRAGTIA